MNKKGSIIIFTLILLILSISTLAVAPNNPIGNDLYYEYDFSGFSDNLDYYFSLTENENIVTGNFGTKGYVLHVYDTDNKLNISRQVSYNGLGVPETSQRQLIGIDTDLAIAYSIVRDSPNNKYIISLHNYSVTDNQVIQGTADTFDISGQNYFLIKYFNLDSSSFIINNNETLFKLGKSKTSISSIDAVSFSGKIIVDMIYVNNFLYVLTSDNVLHKVSKDLSLVSTYSLTLTRSGTLTNYLRYNSKLNKLIIQKDDNTFIFLDTNFNNYEEKDFNIDMLSGSEYSNFYTVDNYIITFNSSNSYFVECNFFTLQCEQLFTLTDLDNYNINYMYSGSTPFGANRHFELYNGFLITPYYQFGSGAYRHAVISGFRTEPVFNDVYTLNYINVSQDIISENNNVNVSINAEHVEGNSFLKYAVECSNNPTIIKKYDFTRIKNLTSLYGYNNACEYTIQDNKLFINDLKGLTFNNCTNNPINLDFDNTNRYQKYKILTSVNNFNNYTIRFDNLFNNTIHYEQDKIIITYNDTQIFNANVKSSQFSFETIDIFYITYYIDLQEQTYIIEVSPYERNTSILSEQQTYSNEKSVINSMFFTSNTVENDFVSQIHRVELENAKLPAFTTTNNFVCSYGVFGFYTIKGYVTSVYKENDYNTFDTHNVEVLKSNVTALSTDLDEVYKLSSFSTGFWKTIIFLAFTLIIISGVYFGSDYMHLESKERLLFFMVFHTIMTFIAGKVLNLFPSYWFIIDLILLSLLFVSYFFNIFGGGGD